MTIRVVDKTMVRTWSVVLSFFTARQVSKSVAHALYFNLRYFIVPIVKLVNSSHHKPIQVEWPQSSVAPLAVQSAPNPPLAKTTTMAVDPNISFILLYFRSVTTSAVSFTNSGHQGSDSFASQCGSYYVVTVTIGYDWSGNLNFLFLLYYCCS